MIYDVIIIGAGAAGLFSAAAHTPGTNGLILEKTKKAGSKLLLSGAGQCNFTHGGNVKDFISHYGKNGTKIRTVLYQQSNLALMEYFSRNGVPCLIREDEKVFPASLCAQDILDLLLMQGSAKGFQIALESPALDIRYEEAIYWITCPGKVYAAKKLIVAAGGCSYPFTGSDGNLFPLLEKLGLTVVPTKPGLTPLYVQDYPYGSLSGISFENAAAQIHVEGASAVQTGPVLFTRDSFSGPAILDLSRYAFPGARLCLRYLPEKNAEALMQELKQKIQGSQKQPATLLCELTGLPKRFAECLCRRLSLPEKAASMTGTDIRSLSALLTCDSFSVSGKGGYNAAMVTSGGVSLDMVKGKNLECKKYPRMHIIGEALDVDGDTGGYNIQFAFASGYAAAKG